MFLFVTGPDLLFVERFFLVSETNIVQGFHVFFPLVFSHSSVNCCMSFRKVHATLHFHFSLCSWRLGKKNLLGFRQLGSNNWFFPLKN